MVKKLVGIYEDRIRPRGKRILIGLLIFFVVFTLAGFFVLPPVLKSILTKELSKTLVREVTINRIRINPYTLSITIGGLLVKDRSSTETFLSCDEIYLNLQSLSALRMALILKEIRVTKPYVRITRNQDLSYNFSDLLEKKEPTSGEKPKLLRFSLNNIRIENGSIDFLDGPKKRTHTVRELRIGIPFLSNIPSTFTYSFCLIFQPGLMALSTPSRGRQNPSPILLKPLLTLILRISISLPTLRTSP